MDKYEYKVKVDTIKEYIGQGKYHDAAEIADGIDWRKCKSSMMLCTISDLYKVTKQYNEAKKLLLLAYEMRQGGKNVCYSLCEVCMKLNEYDQALNFYREFVQLAPKDPSRFVLQYKLYEMQGASLENRIFVLEELKREDYREKWGYELAFLYHKAGEITLCVQECDELILWFGSGKYVYKAMELKQLYEELTPSQQAIYDRRLEGEETKIYDRQTVEETAETDGNEVPEDNYAQETAAEDMPEQEAAYVQEETLEQPSDASDEMDIEVKQIDISPYSTMNLQKEIAEGLKAVMDQPAEVHSVMEEDDTAQVNVEAIDEMAGDAYYVDNFSPERVVDELTASAFEKEEERTRAAQPPKELARQLSQESGGQLRLVVPGEEAVEKQITGQLSIEDVLKEWDRLQKEREAHQRAQVEKLVQEHTGSLFADFEREKLDDLLERLENNPSAEDTGAETAEDTMQESSDETEAYVETEEPEQIEEAEDPESESFTETVEQEQSEPEEEAVIEEETEESEPEEEVVFEEETEESEPEGTIFEVETTGLTEVKASGEEEEPDLSEEMDADTEPEAEEAPGEDSVPEAAAQIDSEESSESMEEDQTEEAADDAEEKEEAANPEQSVSAEEKRNAHSQHHESFKTRSLTEDEKVMYEPFIQSRTGRDKLIHAIDSISMAPYTGNIIVTGDASMDTLALAKTLIREVQQNDRNFSGRVAKITGRGLNSKDLGETFEKVKNGALIIQSACEMTEDTAWKLYKALQQDRIGIIVVLEDTKKNINEMLKKYPDFVALFNARVDMEPPSNDSLVAHAKAYARSREYSIDEFGVLALHNRIEQLQTIDHHVSTVDVRELVDEAIYNADRKNLKHFFDILFGRRYDDEDMIILTEEDFE